MNDLRCAFRQLLKRPGFAAVAILTLALGVGLSTTIFSAVNPILFRPLPFREPDRLVYLNESNLKQGFRYLSISYADYLDWKRQNQVFEELGVYGRASFALTEGDEPERVAGSEASATLFAVLGIQPILGRGFAVDEDRPGGAAVALLSYQLWERRYGANPDMVGRSIALDGRPHTVLGVMPPGFSFPAFAELWRPLVVEAPEKTRGNHSYEGMGRLKPGVTIEQAQAEMAAISERLAEEHPDTNTGVNALVTDSREQMVGTLSTMSWALLGGVGFVLAVACANGANLFLARAIDRRREFAIRAALGAGRSRIVRQLLVESLVLAGIAGGLGLLFSRWGLDLVLALVPVDIPCWVTFGVDGRVVGFTLGASLVTCLLFGLGPAWHAARADVNEGLKETGRERSGGRQRNRLRGLLLVLELAFTVLLLSGAGLMLKTLLRLRQVNPGFNADRLAVFQLALPETHYSSPPKRIAFFSQLQERLARLPGIRSAAAVSSLPLGGSARGQSYVVEGQPAPPPGQTPVGNFRVVTPGYFATMEIPLVKGRDFMPADTASAAPVVIIDAALAQQCFANDNPIGRRLKLGGFDSPDPWMEIIAVAGDVKHYGLDREIRPGFYRPYMQDPAAGMSVVMRTTGVEPLEVIASARPVVRELDPRMPIFRPQAMGQLVRQSFWPKRLLGELLGVFSGLTLVLAAVGIAGAVAHSVGQRTHEIAVRMALGAQRGDVLRLVLHQTLRLALLGVGIGLVAALALTRVMRTLLYEVEPWDPITFVSVSLLLVGTAMFAGWIPARRAARVDPMVALRCE